MKKYILSLLIGTALLSSCLDVDIVDRVEKEDGFFKTEDHALAAINGVYSTLYAFAYHKTNWAIILPTYEDAMFSTGNAVPATVSNNTHSAGSAPVVNFWGELYNGIKNANEVIARVPSISFKSENDKNRIIAEAYFLRALYHYDLMRLYGGVNGIPIVIEPVTGIENAYVPQSPASKVYEQIISDFEYAAGLNDDDTPRLPKRLDPAYTSGRARSCATKEVTSRVVALLL